MTDICADDFRDLNLTSLGDITDCPYLVIILVLVFLIGSIFGCCFCCCLSCCCQPDIDGSLDGNQSGNMFRVGTLLGSSKPKRYEYDDILDPGEVVDDPEKRVNPLPSAPSNHLPQKNQLVGSDREVRYEDDEYAGQRIQSTGRSGILSWATSGKFFSNRFNSDFSRTGGRRRSKMTSRQITRKRTNNLPELPSVKVEDQL